MRKTWRDLEKDHDVHVAASEAKSTDLEKKIGLLDVHMTGEIGGLREDFLSFREDVKPIIDFFKSITFSGRGIFKIVLFLSAVVAMIIGIKSAFFH